MHGGIEVRWTLVGGTIPDFKSVMVRGLSEFSESRHKNLTEQLPACKNNGVFSETTEGALFAQRQ